MHRLCEFFIATPAELYSWGFDHTPLSSLPSIVGQGLGCSDVFLLQSIVDGSFREQPSPSAPVPAICAAWHYAPAVLQVRTDVVEALALALGEQLTEWAQTWAATSAWRGVDFTPERVEMLVWALARLARRANKGDCGLYLWLYDGPPEEAPVGTSQV